MGVVNGVYLDCKQLRVVSAYMLTPESVPSASQAYHEGSSSVSVTEVAVVRSSDSKVVLVPLAVLFVVM